MNPSPNSLDTERIESLKAGILGALSLALAYGAIALGNALVLAKQFDVFREVLVTAGVNLLVRIAIASLSGFLFGVTYRYIIRDEENPQLKAGAVLAFGLVRGLAPAEGYQYIPDTFWLLGVLTIESIFSFAIARLTLDWAIHRHWIKPFKSG
ncbi:MAG TPA: hypothetical protein DDZ80_30125 [Cyanobacteria bacterium UBA8803]|nr:hypothetical protein [Cyanobacteria bacterium UBA9273]HBL62492.1 hypothetical protein [Cyanobacteria bacterium UBA8803]